MTNNKYVVSNRQTVHIMLQNMNNEFCYHIATIQRLHAFPIVNYICKQLNELTQDKYIIDTLKFLEIYANLTVSACNNPEVIKYVYESMQNHYQLYVSTYVGPEGLHGFMPEVLLVFIILPCLHAICSKDDFLKILQVMNIELFNFQRGDYVYNANFKYLKPEYYDLALSLYESMLKDIPNTIITDQILNGGDTNKEKFTAAVLEVFTEANNLNSGHAITLIRNDKNEFYVIDDNRVIDSFLNYCLAFRTRLWKIDIRDIEDETVNELNVILRKYMQVNKGFNQIERRITRFTLDFSNNFIKYTLLTHVDYDVDANNTNNPPPINNIGLAGGDTTNDNKCNDELWRKTVWLTVIFSILTIVVNAVVSVIINKAYDNRNDYDTDD